jgi:hypothetical protein
VTGRAQPTQNSGVVISPHLLARDKEFKCHISRKHIAIKSGVSSALSKELIQMHSNACYQLSLTSVGPSDDVCRSGQRSARGTRPTCTVTVVSVRRRAQTSKQSRTRPSSLKTIHVTDRQAGGKKLKCGNSFHCSDLSTDYQDIHAHWNLLQYTLRKNPEAVTVVV